MEMEILMDGLRDFDSELDKNTTPRIGTAHGGFTEFNYELAKNNPPPPNNLNFMENLGTSVLSSPRIHPPHRIGTSHGSLRNFSSELTKNNPSPIRSYRELCMGLVCGD